MHDFSPEAGEVTLLRVVRGQAVRVVQVNFCAKLSVRVYKDLFLSKTFKLFERRRAVYEMVFNGLQHDFCFWTLFPT